MRRDYRPGESPFPAVLFWCAVMAVVWLCALRLVF